MKKIEPRPSSPSRTATAAELPAVLYVEDEDDNWMVTELHLRQKYRLIRASNDREACDVVRARAGELYAVLMDIQLKGSVLNGVDLTRLLRGRLPVVRVPEYGRDLPRLTAPILFVTAGVLRFTEPELRAAGGNGMVSKPVDFAKLNIELTNVHLNRLMGPRR